MAVRGETRAESEVWEVPGLLQITGRASARGGSEAGTKRGRDNGLQSLAIPSAVLETTTSRVDVQVIKLINRWRKKEAARGLEAAPPMRQVYTQVRSALPTMKEFSRAL